MCLFALWLKAEIAQAYVLTGQVTNGTNGISGVSVAAGTNLTMTDVNGNYSFTNLAGTFVVTPTNAGQLFNPLRQTMTMPPGLSNINFVKGVTNIATIVASCDRPSLAAAVSRGGLVEFGCNGDLLLTSELTIATNLVLDGTNHQITLDGGGTAQIAVITVTNVTVGVNNLVLSNSAGAIVDVYMPPNRAGGVLNISGCTFVNNHASTGGAISNGVTLNVADSTFLLNGFNNSGYGGLALGGAIFNDNNAIATIIGSTFTSNTIVVSIDAEDGEGGAIDNEGGANLVLVNCTFDGNYVYSTSGPGDYDNIDGTVLYNFGGTMALTNCTLTGNWFSESTELPSVFGDTGGQMALRACAFGHGNSIIFDSSAPFTDAGYNITFEALGPGNFFTSSTSRTGTDPLLGPLAGNGGPTMTCAPLAGSPCLDAITNGYYPPTDQRGFTRPYGPAADIGAVEYYPSNNFTITSLTATGASWRVQGNAFPLTTYLLQSSTNLLIWSTVQTNATGPSGLFNALDTTTEASHRFYRTSLP
jgi:hypothetical protein